jgi:hypothetical protein
MSKHTPGPWIAESNMVLTAAMMDEDNPKRGRQIIAEVFGGLEAHANAHLIAAVPELYEALDLLCLSLNMGAGEPDEALAKKVQKEYGSAVASFWLKGRRVLAKARGLSHDPVI